jgi:hypothetical protein
LSRALNRLQKVSEDFNALHLTTAPGNPLAQLSPRPDVL